MQEMITMVKDLIIRSSSAEFLIFERQTHSKGIQVRFEEGDLWLTQKAIGELFNTTRNNITMHINDIYDSYELEKNSTSKKFLLVQNEGNREVKRTVQYYNLDMVISIGYKVNSERAIQFRRWATYILKEFSKKGYIIDKKRMANGAFFDEDYYDSLLAEIREIRLSERRFYQKVTDIYATSVDYDAKNEQTREFFKTIQNKMHYAVHCNTAAEVIFNRVDSKKENIGLTNFNGNMLTRAETEIAKNYLSEKELDLLNRMVSAYLDVAEINALNMHAMTMKEWVKELDGFLTMTHKDILEGAGTISHEKALEKAHKEYDKYMRNHLTQAEKDYLEIMGEDIKKLK